MTNFSKLKRTLAATLIWCSTASAQAAPVTLDSVAAIVNDGIILQSEFDQRLAQIQAQLQSRSQRIPPANILKSQVMERLITDSILLQMAEKQGVKVTDRQLNAAVNDIAARNGMNLEQFQQALQAQGQDYINAREQIRQEMLISQVQQSNVSRRIQVSEQEVAHYLNSNSATSGQTELLLSLIQIAIPEAATPAQIQKAEKKARLVHQELSDGANFAEVAIATSNASNALNGGDLGWRKLAELPDFLASIARNLKQGNISQPIRTPSGFYILQLRDKRGGSAKLIAQTKVRHILLKPSEIRSPAQAQRLIQRLYQRLGTGEAFDKLAKELSDDKGSGSQGGDLGWASPGQMVPEFEQVMNRTPKGELSEPFESRFGWHILQVLDRREQDMREQVAENQARATISKRKYIEELDNWLREIRAEAYVEIK